jgi:hypothetical protein
MSEGMKKISDKEGRYVKEKLTINKLPKPYLL